LVLARRADQRGPRDYRVHDALVGIERPRQQSCTPVARRFGARRRVAVLAGVAQAGAHIVGRVVLLLGRELADEELASSKVILPVGARHPAVAVGEVRDALRPEVAGERRVVALPVLLLRVVPVDLPELDQLDVAAIVDAEAEEGCIVSEALRGAVLSRP
jgi:hypothetical protein